MGDRSTAARRVGRPDPGALAQTEDEPLLAGFDDVIVGRLDDLRLIARVRTLVRRRTET